MSCFKCLPADEGIIAKKIHHNVQQLQTRGISRDHPPRRRRQPNPTPVYVNVYDIIESRWNDRFKKVGLGVYHTGIQVYNEEWSYGVSDDPDRKTGLFVVEPATAMSTFRCQLYVGDTVLSLEALSTMIRRFELEWPSDKYHILHKNCNHFGAYMLEKISTTRALVFPAWTNRAAKIGDVIFPRSFASYIAAKFDEEPPKAESKEEKEEKKKKAKEEKRRQAKQCEKSESGWKWPWQKQNASAPKDHGVKPVGAPGMIALSSLPHPGQQPEKQKIITSPSPVTPPQAVAGTSGSPAVFKSSGSGSVRPVAATIPCPGEQDLGALPTPPGEKRPRNARPLSSTTALDPSDDVDAYRERSLPRGGEAAKKYVQRTPSQSDGSSPPSVQRSPLACPAQSPRVVGDDVSLPSASLVVLDDSPLGPELCEDSPTAGRRHWERNLVELPEGVQRDSIVGLSSIMFQAPGVDGIGTPGLEPSESRSCSQSSGDTRVELQFEIDSTERSSSAKASETSNRGADEPARRPSLLAVRRGSDVAPLHDGGDADIGLLDQSVVPGVKSSGSNDSVGLAIAVTAVRIPKRPASSGSGGSEDEERHNSEAEQEKMRSKETDAASVLHPCSIPSPQKAVDFTTANSAPAAAVHTRVASDDKAT